MKKINKIYFYIGIPLLITLLAALIIHNFELNPRLQCVHEKSITHIEKTDQGKINEITINKCNHFIKISFFKNNNGVMYKCIAYDSIPDKSGTKLKDSLICDTDTIMATDKHTIMNIEMITNAIENYPTWKKSEVQFWGSCIKIVQIDYNKKSIKMIDCHSSYYTPPFSDKLGNGIDSLLQMTTTKGFSNYYKTFLLGPICA